LEVRYLIQVTKSLILTNLEIDILPGASSKSHVLLQYDLVYCNVLNNNSSSHIQSLTAIFRQCFRSLNSYRDRLSCYLTRTFQAWTLRTWLAFKQYNSCTDPFRRRSTSLYVRWTNKARFLPKLYSQNTAFCHEERAMSRFPSPVSMVCAWNACDHDPHFGDQNACILWLGLSYGGPSNKSLIDWAG